ncbi:CdaR family protein [Deinococcus radiomollis]|uniref:CdaR family protein n=1 Tax=Deinococcus radiomollis TaxID=468916 RepID=UPI003892611B
MSGRAGPRRWLSPAYVWRRSVHNLGPKLAALLVAALVWLVATSDRRANVEVGFDVPLEVRDTTGGASRRAVSDLPATVRVTLSGQRTRVQGLQAGNIEASVDTTGAQEGSFTLPVEVRAPDGTKALRVLPARVQGFVDSQLSRRLSVTLSAAAPPAGSLPRYTLTPQTVTFSGPSRLVRTVSRVISQPLNLEAGATASSRLVALTAEGEPVTGIVLRPASVSVRRSDLGTLPVKTVRVLLPPAPAKLKVQSTVTPASVRLVGPPTALAGLNSATAVLTYRAGSYKVTPTFNLPSGVQALDSVVVNLTVTARKTTTSP